MSIIEITKSLEILGTFSSRPQARPRLSVSRTKTKLRPLFICFPFFLKACWDLLVLRTAWLLFWYAVCNVLKSDLESRPQPSRPRPRPRTCQGQCQYGPLFSQNFKTQTFIAGLVMTNFILVARFSKLVMKLTVSFSQGTLKYFRVQWIFFK